jgi:hypothetical protein
MARRIARGLFRLWIVASVVWVCTVGAVTWWVMPQTVILSDATPPPPPGFTLDAPATLPASKPPFDPTKPFIVIPPEDVAPLPDVPQTAPSASLAAVKSKAAIQIAAEIALIPPVLVLAFGAALGWAIKGFRN